MLWSTQDLEKRAEAFRKQVGLNDQVALDPLSIKISGVQIVPLSELSDLPEATRVHLDTVAMDQWSAMSVPLDQDNSKWIVVVNQSHDIKRQKVSIAEELWHIFQGDELTEIVRNGNVYSRSFKKEEEEVAFYLAAATLVPQKAIKEMIAEKKSADEVADTFGVSKELVEYRIKRLGLWNQYKGRDVKMVSTEH